MSERRAGDRIFSNPADLQGYRARRGSGFARLLARGRSVI
jgi:hypothetical protein